MPETLKAEVTMSKTLKAEVTTFKTLKAEVTIKNGKFSYGGDAKRGFIKASRGDSIVWDFHMPSVKRKKFVILFMPWTPFKDKFFVSSSSGQIKRTIRRNAHSGVYHYAVIAIYEQNILNILIEEPILIIPPPDVI